MKFEIGKRQFSAINRAADLFTHPDNGGEVRSRIATHDTEIAKFQVRCDDGDFVVWLPVHFMDTACDDAYVVDLGIAYLEVKEASEPLILSREPDGAVEVLDSYGELQIVLEEKPEADLAELDRLDLLDGLEYIADIDLEDLNQALQRTLRYVQHTDKRHLQNVWVRFADGSIIFLATDGQKAVNVECKCSSVHTKNPICFAANHLKSVHALIQLWSKRARVSGKARCNIFFHEEDGEFVLNLSGDGVEAVYMVIEGQEDIKFRGDWEEELGKQYVQFTVNKEDIESSLRQFDSGMARDDVDFTVTGQQIFLQCENIRGEKIQEKVHAKDLTWGSLPKRRAVLHMAPGLFLSGMDAEDRTYRMTLSLNEDAPLPFYARTEVNERVHVRYVLMPTSGGCHE